MGITIFKTLIWGGISSDNSDRISGQYTSPKENFVHINPLSGLQSLLTLCIYVHNIVANHSVFTQKQEHQNNAKTNKQTKPRFQSSFGVI